MPIRIITENNNFPIQPYDINVNKHFFEAFGNTETEISANWVVRLSQRSGGWLPFTYEEIDDFYQQEAGYTHGFNFNALVEPKVERLFDGRSYTHGGGWIIRGDDRKYYITEEFIKRCYKSSPIK